VLSTRIWIGLLPSGSQMGSFSGFLARLEIVVWSGTRPPRTSIVVLQLPLKYLAWLRMNEVIDNSKV
jgi:hypothetical protein